jgi:hypothetical protein
MSAIRATHSLRSIFFATTVVAGTTFAANTVNAQHPTTLPSPVVHDHTAHAHTRAVANDPLWAGYKSDTASACGCDNCGKKRKPKVKGQVKKVLNTFTKGIDRLIFGTSENAGCESNCDDACPDLHDDGCDAIFDKSCDSIGHAAHQHAHPLPTTVPPRMAPVAPFENHPSSPEMRSAQPLPSNAPKIREIQQAPKNPDPFADDPISTNRPQVRRTALPGAR